MAILLLHFSFVTRTQLQGENEQSWSCLTGRSQNSQVLVLSFSLTVKIDYLTCCKCDYMAGFRPNRAK